MTHPKLEEAIAANKATRATLEQATALAGRIDELIDKLSRLKQYSWVARVELTCGTPYSVPEEIGRAMGQMVINAYEAELSELHGRLEML